MSHYPQADFYAAVALDSWDTFGPTVAAALAPWAGRPGVAVDAGAGTGLSTQVLASVFAGEVLACEPAFALRASLMTRVTGDPDLIRRTTVLPWDVDRMIGEISEPLTVVTAFNMFGHVGDDTRAAFWAWLGRWLTDDGVAVIGPIAEQDTGSRDERETPLPSRAVGRLTYSATARAETIDDTHGRWHLTWRIHDGDRLVDERSSSFDWQRAHPEVLIAAAAEHGLTARLTDDGLLLATRA
ncbi:methyltransferase domain-containing protein [Glycomyces albidus]|uniref:Methyltransferase domain-containing protein n=1 Tax=Glycomyces albidus TaxID=2656774 RepID=A0A6L5GAM0_9ACTN|nr:class I SAM-dependent methyltransferase [Glycomyces albidus]MQM26593.1 hypothetical protein [Glycomyces albidus]